MKQVFYGNGNYIYIHVDIQSFILKPFSEELVVCIRMNSHLLDTLFSLWFPEGVFLDHVKYGL